MSKVFPRLSRELCSAACSALLELQSQFILAKPLVKNLLVNSLLKLKAVVQAVSLPIIFVMIWYPSNNKQRVVEACCALHMGEYGEERVRAGKGWLNPPFITTMAGMGVQLQDLLTPELAGLLPPCKPVGKICPYCYPNKSERTSEKPAGPLREMGSDLSPMDHGCFAQHTAFTCFGG